MNNQIIIGVLAIVLIGGGAYYFTTSSHTDGASGEHATATHGESNSTGTNSVASGAKVAGTRINIKNSSFKSGSQSLSFELFGQDFCHE